MVGVVRPASDRTMAALYNANPRTCTTKAFHISKHIRIKIRQRESFIEEQVDMISFHILEAIVNLKIFMVKSKCIGRRITKSFALPDRIKNE